MRRVLKANLPPAETAAPPPGEPLCASTTAGPPMTEMRYGDALKLALREEMRRDENVILMGEDIGVFGGAFKVRLLVACRPVRQGFGERRVRDAPISENTMVREIGMGATMVGLRAQSWS